MKGGAFLSIVVATIVLVVPVLLRAEEGVEPVSEAPPLEEPSVVEGEAPGGLFGWFRTLGEKHRQVEEAAQSESVPAEPEPTATSPIPTPIPTPQQKVSPEPEATPVVPDPSLDLDLGAARQPQEPGSTGQEIELPSEEIRGEIEKPEIFFLLPRARDRSDEQMIRARIRREIIRPLIKDWLEEDLMLR